MTLEDKLNSMKAEKELDGSDEEFNDSEEDGIDSVLDSSTSCESERILLYVCLYYVDFKMLSKCFGNVKCCKQTEQQLFYLQMWRRKNCMKMCRMLGIPVYQQLYMVSY